MNKKSSHKESIEMSVAQLEGVVAELEKELRRKEADLKIMRLMAAQCGEKSDDIIDSASDDASHTARHEWNHQEFRP